MIKTFSRNHFNELLVIIVVVFSFFFKNNAYSQKKKLSPSELKLFQKHFDKGVKYFKEKKFKESLGEFMEAYFILPNIDTVWNIARCHEELKEYKLALRFFLKYLSLNPDEEGKEDAQNRIKKIQEILAKTGIIIFYDDKSAVVKINGKVIKDWFQTLIELEPGKYEVEVTVPGYKPWKKVVTVVYGKSVAVNPKPEPLQTVEVVKKKSVKKESKKVTKKKQEKQSNKSISVSKKLEKKGGMRDYLWIGWVSGGAFVSFGVVSTMMAISKNNEINDLLSKPVSKDNLESVKQQIKDLESQRNTWGYLQFVGYGIGGALLIGTTVLYFTGKSKKQKVSFSFVSNSKTPFVLVNVKF